MGESRLARVPTPCFGTDAIYDINASACSGGALVVSSELHAGRPVDFDTQWSVSN